MSRVGLNPIDIPDGVEVSLEGRRVVVKGPKGERAWELHDGVSVTEEDGRLLVARASEERHLRALHGLTRAELANRVTGVSDGFRRDLEIVGVGYRAQAQGSDVLELQLGYSHPVRFEAPEGITFEVPEPTKVSVLGIDKQLVGQVAADIRKLRRPEPYKGKGIRYAEEQLRRKAGKAAAAAGA